MTEVADKIVGKAETSPNLEVPRNTTLVKLPAINDWIRLGMHTDSTRTLLRTLNSEPQLDQVKIEGRVLTQEQERRLEESQEYQFYMSGRAQRGRFTMPDSLRFTPEQIASLLQGRFSPDSLGRKIGHKVGYFNAKALVDQWIRDGNPNKLLPIIGGVNEFSIGSDTLSQEQLASMSSRLLQAFVDQEASKLSAPIQSFSNSYGSNSYSLSYLSKLISNKGEFKKEKIINLNDLSLKRIEKFSNFEKIKKH